MSYSDALEQQVRLLQLVRRPEFRSVFFGREGTSASQQRDAAEATTKTLARAESFYWAPEFCELLDRAAADMPAWTLRQEAIPAPAGFWWFAQPISLPLWDGDAHPLRAISWFPLSDNGTLTLQTVFWIDYDWAIRAPIPTNIWGWRVGETNEISFEHRAMNSVTVWQGDRLQHKLRVFAAGLAFLEQQLLVSSREQVDRHAKHRLEREGWLAEPLVRIVRLRRLTKRAEAPVDPVVQEWSCKWMVRGHWRQQFYPSKHANLPIWITPYVKGPENKPLKPPRATVFAVVR